MGWSFRCAILFRMKAFRVMGRVLSSTWEELFLLVSVSLVWWVGLVLIVTAAPATLGLNGVANRIANYRRSSLEFFWADARKNIGKAWALFAGILFAVFLIVLNIWFYSNGPSWMRLLTILWLWVLILFLMIAQYLFPLICQQTEPNIGQALRNGAVLAMRSPLYSFLMLLFHGAVVIASVALVLPLLFLMPGMLALSSNFALTGLLQEMDLAPLPPESPRR